MSMHPAQTRALLAAVATATHRHLGIRPTDAAPSTRCAYLASHDAAGLASAFDAAGQAWPATTGFTLYGADSTLDEEGGDAAGDVGLASLANPIPLSSFSAF